MNDIAYRDQYALVELLEEVRAEADRQDEKWGWPRPKDFLIDFGDGHGIDLRPIYDKLEAASRVHLEDAPNWMAILGEEVGEVARENDPDKRVVELVQAAAVCLAWAQAIQERKS